MNIRVLPINWNGARNVNRDARERSRAESKIRSLLSNPTMRPEWNSATDREQYYEQLAEQIIRLIEACPTPRLIGTYLRMLANVEALEERDRQLIVQGGLLGLGLSTAEKVG